MEPDTKNQDLRKCKPACVALSLPHGEYKEVQFPVTRLPIAASGPLHDCRAYMVCDKWSKYSLF